jgi:hypothetical protein
MLAAAPAAVGRRAPRPPEAAAPAAVTAPAELTERDALFAFHRMAGTEPDFRALAELVVAARPPPRHRVRDEAAEHRYLLAIAMRRLRAEFAAFELDRPFTVELGADILGHDREAGGIPLDLGPRPALPLRDPTDRRRGFELRFRNAGAARVIPVPDADAAAMLLRDAGLASFGDRAGAGTVRLTVVFAGVLPRVAEVQAIPLSVEILSAAVEAASGAALHALDHVGSVAAARAAPPTLPDAAIAGLRIGMPLEEVQATAARDLPERSDGAFFDVLPERARRFNVRPDCSAGVVADIRAFGIPLAPEDSYGACLAIVPGAADDALAGRVAEITRLRFLPGATAVEVQADLQERFGPPLEELGRGRLAWVGRDPVAGAPHDLLELRAEYVRVLEGGPRREAGLLLALTLRRHVPGGDDGS